MSLPTAFSQSTTSANDFRVPPASCHVNSTHYLPHDLLAMHRRMLPPMFPSPVLGGSHKLADQYPMFALNSQEVAKSSTPISSEEVGKSNEIGDNSTSCNSSINNSSFDKHNSSFSEGQEQNSESEDSIEDLDVENSTINDEEADKNSKKTICQDLGHAKPSPTQSYPGMFHEHYKQVLPWLFSQCPSSGPNSLNNFWKRFQEATSKDKLNKPDICETSGREKFLSEQLHNEWKDIDNNSTDVVKTDETSKLSHLKGLKRSRSLPNDTSNHEEVISESFSDPGKQSPSHSSSDDDFFKESPEKLLEHESIDKKYSETSPHTNELSQSCLTDSHHPTSSLAQNNLTNAAGSSFSMNRSPENTFESLPKNDSDTFSNKEKSSVLPGGEIHGGVWIPTRSRNCHLCGKEFKNVYR